MAVEDSGDDTRKVGILNKGSENTDEFYWFFVPKYTSKIDMIPIFEADNTQSSIDFTIVEEVSTGIVSSNEKIASESLATGIAIEKTIEKSAEVEVGFETPFVSGSASANLGTEDTTSESLAQEFNNEYTQQ